ncbi:ComEC/Rec2 family competence protein [Salinarchaeum laminariae]|uniref:ComEC/Rec2 family competence protein n=1 Tax=Salinarchaeum laminariae TaxID=869888 RepID=UPI0020C0F141|nr:ComEC/Rec2 family competence protein [Salinarchaeum laminariae]
MRRLVLASVLCLLVLSAGCLGAIGVEVETEAQEGPTGSNGEFGPSTDLEPVDADLSVHYIDVGQADATFVRGPGNETMLIDTGHWQDDGETVIEYLEARNVDRIDYLVSTHAHADHIGGSAAVIRHFETEGEGIGAVYDSGVPTTSATYENYLDAIEQYDVTLYETRAGDEIPLNGTTTTVLNPPANHETDDLDANTIAVRIGYGDAGFLFTGDMTSETEPELVDRWGEELQSTVYQAGHHGSSTSSSGEFLDAVNPQIAIVSSAYDSQYGHPHDEPLQRFADRGIDTYWTGSHGTIVAGTDGDAVTIRTVANATTDPTELRDAPPADVSASAEITVRGTYEVGAPSAGAVMPASAEIVLPVSTGSSMVPATGGVDP